MADSEPRIEITPATALTSQELIINLFDLPTETELTLRITGPISGFWGNVKSDLFGQAQLIWRAQVAGDYSVEAKGEDIDLSGEFSVEPQEGEEQQAEAEEEPKAEAKPEPKPEPKTTTSESKPKASATTKSETGSKAR